MLGKRPLRKSRPLWRMSRNMQGRPRVFISWSIARATLTHYALVVLCYLMMSLLLRFNNGFWETLMMLGIMTVAFFLIWLILYLIFRRQVRELNELNRKKAKR